MNALLDWVEQRTGVISASDRFLDRPLAGAPSWRYLLPASLVFTFVLEVLTGLFLWMFYSPHAHAAWESIFWLQEMTRGGWLLRGIHFYAGHVMVVLAGLYLVQLVLTGAYRAPREFVFWASLLMFVTLLGFLLTGDLLRWDQEGYWSTQVRVRFLTLLPLVGADAFKVASGGPDFGHLTLTRFFALHAGVCTLVFAGLLMVHAALVRRQGLKRSGATPGFAGATVWPAQTFLNLLFCGLVLVLIGLLVVQNQFRSEHAGLVRGAYLGAPLGAPADPAEAYAAARPEWAFLALYQFTNIFPGEGIFGSNVSWKVVPIFVVPGLVALWIVLMPLTARVGGKVFVAPWGYVGLGHLINVAMFLLLLVALAGLSMASVRHDRHNLEHQKAVAAGHAEAQRAKQLAHAATGIPPGGALTLLRNDPKTQGPRLFQQVCASCHSHANAQGEGIVASTVSAPNLFRFASRGWIAGLLNPKKILTPDYFGNTTQRKGEMANFVRETLGDKDVDPKQVEAAVMSLSAEARLNAQRADDVRDAARIAEGKKSIIEDFGCTDCHKFHDKGQTGNGPELTGYGSREWLIGIISNPSHKRFYGKKNDRMPAYAEFPDQPGKNLLSGREIELLADWLRGEWYEAGR